MRNLIFALILFLSIVFFGASPAFAQAGSTFDSEVECRLSGCSGTCNDITVGDQPTFVCYTSTGGTGALFGKIKPPAKVTSDVSGLGNFIGAILRLLVIAGGVWALFNFIIAGYQFIQAGGDAKAVSAAWARIWQSLVGIVIIAASFLFAAIIGQIFFGSPTAILSPKLITP
ncbi:MAG: hypothetical protein HYW33_04125 [Candidatus Blackburnbacteria bacterium]|nr:hypothetical protein [Candidatus Blackburnbacteria bacterium]